MKLTSPLNRKSQANPPIPATTSAVRAAMLAQRAGSPPAMPATVVPTSMEMADVGPTANCRDVPKSAYAIPATK
jgi:hypothetical protein